MAASAAVVGATPNQVTAASGLMSGIAFVVVAAVAPTLWVSLVATTLLILAYVLDSADGQLARVTGTGGPAGEWLDHVIDAARHLLMHLSLVICLHRFTDLPEWSLLLPLCFATVASTRFFALILAEKLRGAHRELTPPTTESTGGQRHRDLLGSLIQLPTDTGVLNFVVVLLPWPRIFLGVYAAFLAANVIIALASVVRKFAELSKLAAPRLDERDHLMTARTDQGSPGA